MRRIELILAWRFLGADRRGRVLALFSLVTALGIAGSVGLFLAVSTVMDGFSEHLREALQGFDAPLVVEYAPAQSQTVSKVLKASFNPVYAVREFDGLVAVDTDPPTGVKVRAVDPDYLTAKEKRLGIHWSEGHSQKTFSEAEPVILLGEGVYKRLRFFPGEIERVQVTHPFAELGPAGEIEPQEGTFIVAGIFNTGFREFDDSYALVSQGSIDALADEALLRHKSFLEIHEADLETVRMQMLVHLQDTKAKVLSWRERNVILLKAMRLERLVFSGLFAVIVLIACFNVAGVVALFGAGRAREAAVLLTLGLSRRRVAAIFLYLAVILGVVGTLLGIGFGELVIFCLNASGALSAPSYQYSDVWLKPDWITAVGLFVCMPFVAAAAAYFPARAVARGDVAQTLRLT